MADRIAVMREGAVEQVGAPDELYERPATRFVAAFLGDANMFTGTVTGARVGDWQVREERLRAHGLGDGDEATVVVRPERLQLCAPSSGRLGTLANVTRGRVAEVAYMGMARKYVIDLEDGATVQSRVPAHLDDASLTAGNRVEVGWELDDGVVVPGAEPAVQAEAAADTAGQVAHG